MIGGRVLSEKNNHGSNMVVDLIRKQECNENVLRRALKKMVPFLGFGFWF